MSENEHRNNTCIVPQRFLCSPLLQNLESFLHTGNPQYFQVSTYSLIYKVLCCHEGLLPSSLLPTSNKNRKENFKPLLQWFSQSTPKFLPHLPFWCSTWKIDLSVPSVPSA